MTIFPRLTSLRFALPALVGAGVVLTLLPNGMALTAAFVLIGLVGLPHGASDTALAVPRWQARFGSAGRLLFLAAYVGAALGAYLLWQLFPLAGLSAFLLLSAYHFGHDDLPPALRGQTMWGSPQGWLRGALVLSGPALIYRGEVAGIFSALLPPGEGEGAATLAELLHLVGFIALPLSAAIGLRDDRQRSTLLRSLVCLVPFPPMVGFPLYFAFVHSLHQTEERGRRLGTDNLGSYLRRCWPFVLGGVAVMALVGAALTTLPERSVAALFIGLAVLTLPHILFGGSTRSPSATKSRQRLSRPDHLTTSLTCEPL
jgi:Brp/Blh family beta-carotene 15,15'-monooxygenase